ncbi:MAG: hypothetical protein ACLPQS_15495 [Acidimicrobiales bacterium]
MDMWNLGEFAKSRMMEAEKRASDLHNARTASCGRKESSASKRALKLVFLRSRATA